MVANYPMGDIHHTSLNKDQISCQIGEKSGNGKTNSNTAKLNPASDTDRLQFMEDGMRCVDCTTYNTGTVLGT